MKEVVHTG